MYSRPVDYDRIIGADYKADGTPTGAYTLLKGDVRIVPGTESPPDPNGVYQARVEVPVQMILISGSLNPEVCIQCFQQRGTRHD